MRLTMIVLGAALAATAAAGARPCTAQAGDTTRPRRPLTDNGVIVRGDSVVDSGSFRIFKLQYPLGAERYETRRRNDTLYTTIRTSFNYLGTDVALEASMRERPDGHPVGLEIKGETSTATGVDVDIDASAATVLIREGRVTRELPRPARFFPATPYPPATVVDRLHRYWSRTGRPASVPILPRGSAVFETRGHDQITLGGRRHTLRRLSLRGLTWGRQTIWIDGDGRLVATIGGDAELDRLQAVREGFEAALPALVAASVRDGIADLAGVARDVRPRHAGAFAIVGARLIDGTGGTVVDSGTVVVREGRIAAAGAAASVTVPRGIPTIDGVGKTVLPGLWDMHGHYEQVEWPAVALAAGITTVRDAANELELVTALRDAIDAGRAIGPRMLLAGVIDGGAHPLGVITASTPEEARAAVQRYARARFQQIKIYQSLQPWLVKIVADEAHRLGMTVTGHVPTGMNAIQFVESGADQINHLNFITSVLRPPPRDGRPSPVDLESAEAKRAIAFLRERRTVLDPSLARGEQFAHPRDSGFARYEPGVAKAPAPLREVLNSTGTPPEVGTRGLTGLDRSLAIVGALHKAGIPIVLGTDLTVPGHSIHRELELAVRAGLTPMQAIQAATIVPARAMHLDKESGTVEVGKRADLLIVDGNPLASITDTRKVRGVVANGRWYDPAPLWRAGEFQP